MRSTASVTEDPNVTTGKYPEYAKVWEDGSLNVVALFGLFEENKATDDGEAQFLNFLDGAKKLVPGSTTKDNRVSSSILKDVTIEGKVRVQGAERPVRITVLLFDTLFRVGTDFDTRYDALSERADLIVYNGHSELGKNTDALAKKGKVAPKQYQLFFFDSCDTFAYLQTNLADRRREVNGADDPKGTKYLDVATDVLPSYFHYYAASSLTFVKAFIERDTPKTYNQLLTNLPAVQVVVITGEEDNAFRP